MKISLQKQWLLAGALAFLAVVATFDPKLYVNGDNIDYMNLARAVRQGRLWGSDKYPPLFPLLLAPVQALFGMRLIPQKILVTLFAGGAIWMLAGIVRRRTHARSGPWLLFAAATLIPFVEYAHYVMSEVPFLFFQLGALAACDRLASFGEDRRARRELGWLALWIAAAFYTRSAGVALAGGVLLWLLLSRRPRQALLLAGFLGIALVPWIVHSAAATGGSPYLRQLLQVNPYYPELGRIDAAGLLQRAGENARLYLLGMVPAAVMPALYGSTYSPPDVQKLFYPFWIAIPLLVPLAAGIWRGLRGSASDPPSRAVTARGHHHDPARDAAVASGEGKGRVPESRSYPARWRDPAACVVLFSLLLLLLWPSIWSGSRFLVPIVPLLLLAWWGGWILPEEKRLPGAWAKIRAGFLVLLVLLGVRNLVFYVQETRSYPPEWENYFTSLTWIREHTPQDAVVIDRKPGFVEFVAGRKSLTFPREQDPERMLAGFRQNRVTHVVVPSLPYDDIQRYLVPLVETRHGSFKLAYRTPKPTSYVLELIREGEPSGVNPAE